MELLDDGASGAILPKSVSVEKKTVLRLGPILFSEKTKMVPDPAAVPA